MPATDLWMETAGDGAGIVLVHAGIADARMWEPQWEAFAAHGKVVRYDMRGFGRSPASEGKPFRHRDDLLAVMDAAGLQRATFVACSMGCGVAVEAALTQPDRVAGLVLAAPTLTGFPAGAELETYFAEDEALALEGKMEARVELALRMWVDGADRRPEQVDAEVREAMADIVRDTLAREGDQEGSQWMPEAPGARLEELRRFPTLVILGAHDAPTVHATARALVERAGAQGAQLGGAAHFPNLERAQAFNDLVGSFLRSRVRR